MGEGVSVPASPGILECLSPFSESCGSSPVGPKERGAVYPEDSAHSTRLRNGLMFFALSLGLRVRSPITGFHLGPRGQASGLLGPHGT